jgi:hypothetical protein
MKKLKLDATSPTTTFAEKFCSFYLWLFMKWKENCSFGSDVITGKPTSIHRHAEAWWYNSVLCNTRRMLCKKKIRHRQNILIRHHSNVIGYLGALFILYAAIYMKNSVISRRGNKSFRAWTMDAKANGSVYVSILFRTSSTQTNFNALL